jgi:uncharacterized repeat protein (TIGR02543 family)
MKTWKNALFGLVAIIAFGFAFVGCDDGNGNNSQPKTYSVTFNADNGTQNITQTVSEGGRAPKPADPTKVGYGFAYWFNETTGDEWNFNMVITANLNLKAKWNINQYSVTFNADNGTENTIQTVTEGNKAIKPEDPTKSGYDFVCWFNEATGDEWNFDTIITTEYTLKAEWTPDGKTKESAILLSFNNWIERNHNLWFYFTATATTQYIHIDCGTAMQPGFSVYDNNGIEIGLAPSYPYGGGYGSRTVTIGQTYYINISQIYDETFKVAFNDSDVPPAIILPDNGITQLTHNTWTDCELTPSNREQWFGVIATTDIEYMHCSALSGYIRLYDQNGVAVGSGLSTQGGISFSRNVIIGQLYYIKIWAIQQSITYKIAFNSINAQPPITLPTENINQLSLDSWVKGEVANEDQWHRFTATANTQYIYTNVGTMYLGFVQLYDNSGVTVGERAYMHFPASMSRSVTVGNEYYIRVYPYHANGNGTYQIVFSESDEPPAIALPNEGVNPLTENTWVNGEIVSSIGQQWFIFTASANTQYVHFILNTLWNIGCEVYNANGELVYSRMYSSALVHAIPVTIGNNYYLKVWGAYSQNGTYDVAFNTTEVPPTQ